MSYESITNYRSSITILNNKIIVTIEVINLLYTQMHRF